MKYGIHNVLKAFYQVCVFDPDLFRGGSRAGPNRSKGVPSFKNFLLRNRSMDLKTKCIKAVYKDGLLKFVFFIKIREIKIDAFLMFFWTSSKPCKIAYFFYYYLLIFTFNGLIWSYLMVLNVPDLPLKEFCHYLHFQIFYEFFKMFYWAVLHRLWRPRGLRFKSRSGHEIFFFDF